MRLRDDLQLYPSAADMALVWSIGVGAQLALRIAWQAACQQMKTKAGNAWEQSVKGHSAVPLWCSLTVGAGLHRTTVWMSMARRALWLTIVVSTVVVVANSVLLYLRTGSWVQHPYGWYSLQSTGRRVFSDRPGSTIPSDILDTCLRPNQPPHAGTSELLKMHNAIADLGNGSTPTVVYVVPYGPEGVVEVSAAQATVGIAKNARETQLRGVVVDYARAVPVDLLTMFPYLWLSILGPGFSDAVSVVSPWQRVVGAANVEYRLIRSQSDFNGLPAGSNVFGIVQGMGDALHLADALPRSSKVGYIALSREDCNNPQAQRLRAHKQISFGMLPYGDCSLIDGDRFSILPLGPSFEHGFPVNTHQTRIPGVAGRAHLLNLMVSWTAEKPTRIQARMAALRVCSAGSFSCIIEHNDLLFKVLQKIDMAVGTNLRWLLSSAPNVYVENLKQSVFTLCPFGKNPEQYRIWEALAAGSIPIVEDMPATTAFEPGQFYHPSYPRTWKCRAMGDVHAFLKRYDAPVLFVTDWKRDLPKLVQYYVQGHPEELERLQARAKQWYQDMGEHLQAEYVTKTIRFFGRASNHD